MYNDGELWIMVGVIKIVGTGGELWIMAEWQKLAGNGGYDR